MRTLTLAALTATLIFSGSTFAQEAFIGDVNSIQYDGYSISNSDCGCESSNIVPVVYQESLLENSLEGAVIAADAGTVEPMAGSTSVVESPIVDSANNYDGIPMGEGEVIVEGTPMNQGEMIVQGAPLAEGEMMVQGAPMTTPSCGCQSAAAPMAAPAPMVSQGTPVFTSASSVASPCCNTPARRGFFSRIFGR